MEVQELMAELEKLGTEQNRKIYRRHGYGDKFFGVSFANFEKLRKKIKTDHALAQELWKTGNSDARVLATMIADPQAMAVELATAWMKEVNFPLLADYLARLLAASFFARKLMESWMKSKEELVRLAGYSLLGCILKDNGQDLTDEAGEKLLARLEKEIHASPNCARYTMNNALIALGVYRPGLTKKAIETARRIGKVEVDHGDTSCKTPDAISTIEKTLAHHAKKKK